jgi:hypothetical protein
MLPRYVNLSTCSIYSMVMDSFSSIWVFILISLVLFTLTFNSASFASYILYLQELALPSPTSGCRSVDIVCFPTEATDFSLALLLIVILLICTSSISL